MSTRRTRAAVGGLIALAVVAAPSCSEWRGLNTLNLPGTQGHGPGAFTIQAQFPDVDNLDRNSRVRVNDVNVGTVTKIERQGWNALVTMRLNGDVKLPANARATVGQTGLFGSLHVELAPPVGEAAEGRLHDGSLIPLSRGRIYPTTEDTLAAVSLLLNGGGVGQIQDITKALATAFNGREQDLRSLIEQLDKFISYANDQKDDIIGATESLNNLVGQFAAQKPVLDKALKTVPDALVVLKDQRNQLADALVQLGRFSALAADSVNQTKESLVQELRDLGPTLKALADAGPSLTRALSLYPTFPWPKETLDNWMRGDYGNLSLIFDLTLSRVDSGLFTGTRWEGDLTELELQWGRTIGQLPSPYTHSNPLIVPYHWDQGR